MIGSLGRPLDGRSGLLNGVDAAWSRTVVVPAQAAADGVERTWHLLDNQVADPVGTLLCVHGNPTWSYVWRRLLAEAPPGWRVVAPDQLGMGWSERPAGRQTLDQRVRDLGALTAHLGIDGPVVTLAHDWGGPVSLGWAVGHRDQVVGTVLSNTAVGLPLGTSGPSLIRLADTAALRELVCVRTPAFLEATLRLSKPSLAKDVRTALAAPYRTAARRRAIGGFVADIPFRADHPTRAVVEAIAAGLATLDRPALLVWGPRDPVFGEAYLDDLRRRLPHADVQRFAAASHLVMEDEPAYAATVWRWVGGLDAPQPDPPGPAGERPQLWAALDERADDDSPAVVEVGGRTVSWRVFHRRVAEVAAGLVVEGVRPGDRVALLVPPSADLALCVYAVWRAGAVIVVADKGLGVRGMGRALRSARVDHLIGTAEGLAAARAMRLRPPGLRIAVGSPYRLLGASQSLADVARAGRGHGADLPEPSGDDECAVVFTSGATGPAKGVVYRHRQLRAQVALIRSTYQLSAADRIVAAFAPFALYGPALGIGSAVPDMDVTAPGTLTAVTLAEAVAAVGGTVVFASPAALRNVVATADELTAEHRKALWGVRLLMSAGAPVPRALLSSVSGVLPAEQMHTPYGMTEALPVTDISIVQIRDAGLTFGSGVCVGRPLPGVELRLSALSSLGLADGPLVAEPGVVGEICVRAEHVKDRYDALWVTEQASSRDAGWHRTGDVGHLDDEGRLWVEGRLVHVITTAGGVVTPVEVEQRAEVLAGVRQAAAVGVGPVGAQVVVLIVVPVAAQRGPLADLSLTTALREVGGFRGAAVLVRDDLPVDIRHQSKIDRQSLAIWATTVLSGARP